MRLYKSTYHAEYAVKVVRQRRPLKRGTTTYIKLKWRSPTGGWKFKAIGRDLTNAEVEQARKQKELDLNTGAARPEGDGRAIALGTLKATYAELRRQGATGRGYRKGVPKLCEKTIIGHLMTLRYLSHHFGESHTLGSITVEQAEAWIEALAANRLSAVRSENASRTGMSDHTVRDHIRNAKAIVNWAAKAGRLGTSRPNPFSEFKSKPITTPANPEVKIETFEAVLAEITNPGERACYGLMRLAGLRKGEAVGLPWSGRATDSEGAEHRIGVDLNRRRICLVAAKTRIYREAPIVPRLHELLAEAGSSRPTIGDGVSVSGLSGNNLDRRAEQYCRAAGVTKWRDFFQSMRSSCENGWKADGFAEATYCSWIGHDPKVSRKHYVSPTEAEYARVTEVA